MPEISAKQRDTLGKRVGALRRQGFLPAVLYGEGVGSTPLSVSAKDFEKALKEAGESSLVILKVEDGKPGSRENLSLPGKTYNVLIHDVAKDPLTLQPIHADFYAVRMDKPIEAKVPLVFVGESPAVKNEGGILVKVIYELEVKALPKDLPHELTVDLSRLEHVEDRIQVSDLTLPAGVEVRAGADGVVALVEPPRAEAKVIEAVAPPEAAVPVEVKTEREVKAEEKAKEAEETEK